MAEETKLEEKVEETKEAVAEAVEKAEEAVEKVEAAAEKADEPKVEAAAEKAEEALEKVEEAIEKHEAAEAKAEVEIPKHFKDVVEKIEKMTVLELAELVKVLEEKFGVSAAPVAVAAAGGAAAGGAEAAEEKSAYNIMLDAAGDQKINVIKAVREITGLGLAESKALVDGAPKEIKQNVPKAEAEEAVAKLKEAGATASLK